MRSGRFRPAWPGCPGVAGLVTTWHLSAARPTAQDAAQGHDDPLAAMLGALADVEDAGILLIDAGGSATAQCFGGALASAARYLGVAGTLVHGAVRDTAELAQLGFPTYSVGVYPARLRGRLALQDTRVTIRLPDGPVDDGDFVVADADGAVFVPADRLPEVVPVARRIATDGRALLSRLQDGGALLRVR